ncbi:MAG: hypothetical protein MSA98_10515 [Spirochaetia bacterium]|nr:hypothetical protein [Spirochaetia bacterium]
MKYTIEGFDQKQLISYSLDACDALILRWFIDFSVSGKMKKTIRGRKIFYLVRYQSIIDDLPILGIENPRNIGRRFDKFVSCGLLEKEIIREGTGTQTIFCPTDKVNALSYKENNVLKVSESTIRENTTVPENTVIAPMTVLKSTVGENLEETESKVIADDTKVLQSTITEDNIIQENNALKVSESTIRENTTVPENTVIAPVKVLKSTVMDSRQYSKVPSDGTQKYGALNKFFYQNSSTTATENLNLKNNQSDKTHNIAAVVSKLKINFEKYINCSIFSDDFWQNLASTLIDHGLAEKISEYTQFLFENLGKVGNAANYIYKTAGSHYRIQQFINTLSIANSKKQENEHKHFCVVCTEPFWGDVCPCCGFQNKNSYNEQLVEQARYKYKFG